ncbi:cell division protein FtsL, partial [Serratia ureilytica]|nr:cell division protein FtsL [Serratia ureilytica]
MPLGSLAIRACLTDLLFQLQLADAENPLLNNEILLQPQVAAFAGLLHPLLSQYAIRLTDEGEQYLIFYCAVALRRNLILEENALGDHSRVERIATEKLQM